LVRNSFLAFGRTVFNFDWRRGRDARGAGCSKRAPVGRELLLARRLYGRKRSLLTRSKTVLATDDKTAVEHGFTNARQGTPWPRGEEVGQLGVGQTGGIEVIWTILIAWLVLILSVLRFMLRSHAGTGWKQLFPEWKQ
jgi:hypothetical protein